MPPPRPIAVYVSPYRPHPEDLEIDEEPAPLYDFEHPAAQPVIDPSAITELQRVDRDLDARATEARAFREVQMIDVDDDEEVDPVFKGFEQFPSDSLSTVVLKRPSAKALSQHAPRQLLREPDEHDERLNEQFCRSRFGVELCSEDPLSDDLYQQGPELQILRGSSIDDMNQLEDPEDVYYPQPEAEEVEMVDEPSEYYTDQYEEPFDRETFIDEGHHEISHANYHTVGPGYHSFASALGRSDQSGVEPKRKRVAKPKRQQVSHVSQQGNGQRKLATNKRKADAMNEGQVRGSGGESVATQLDTENLNLDPAIAGWHALLPFNPASPDVQQPEKKKRRRGEGNATA